MTIIVHKRTAEKPARKALAQASGKGTRVEANLSDISDGKLYSSNDMVRLGCKDCAGCFACCEDMGESVLLDPYDVWQLTNGLGLTFEELLGGPVELHMEEGLIYPNLRMVATRKNDSIPHCVYLNDQGRCEIHDIRPGICRLFPLGRNYTPEKLDYFLLTDACPKASTKIKIQKWLGIGKIKDYEAYLVGWHNFTKEMRAEVLALLDQEGEEAAKKRSMEFLQFFYMIPYKSEDFFGEWKKRMEAWINA